MTERLYWTIVLALSIIGAAIAVVLLWPHPKPVVETAKPAVVQSDGSTILERTDTQPEAKPPHVVPKGATVERVVQVKVKPKVVIADGIKDAPSLSPDAKPANNPITVDLSLVRLTDDTKRVIASSPDGEIVGGMDIPIETLAYKPRVWAAGISVDPVHQVGGVWVERDISRIRVGVDAGVNKFHDFETRLRVGVTW
jgi:hypothetical protein